MRQRATHRSDGLAGKMATTGRRQRLGSMATILIVVLVVAACGTASEPIESPITEDEATEMAENALQGFNEGDYTAWSRDWSETMKSAIDEEAFLAFRDQYHGQLGDWTGITEVSGAPGSDEGTYRWTFDLEFENGGYRMWFGLKEGSPLIEGVSFEEIGA